jgi:Spy/CpxP family protein refolding chaperone
MARPGAGRPEEEDMKTWQKALLAVPLLAGVVVLAGWRGGCGGHHGPPDPERANRMITARVEDALDDLDAAPEQRAKVLALKDRLLQQGMAAREGHRETVQEVVAQWDAATPDAAKLHALVDARIDAMRRLAHEAADAGVELHAVLTPEQRAKLSRKLHRWTDPR